MHLARPLIPFLALVVVSAARAETIHVPADTDLANALATVPEGGNIVIAAGHYTGPFTLDGKYHVTIRGKGKVVLDSAANFALRVVDSGDVTLRNLEFAPTATVGLDVLGTYVAEVRDCRVAGTASTGISLSQSFSVWIDDCEIDGAQYGIIARGGAHLITGVVVKKPVIDAIRIEADDCVIADSRIEKAGVAGVFVASSNADSHRIVVANVDVLGALTGIHVGDGGESVLVRDCKVTDAGGNLERGMFIETDATGVVLADNRVTGGTIAGMHVQCNQVVVTGNRVSDCPDAGFSLDASSTFGLWHANRAKHCGGAGFHVNGGANAFVKNKSTQNTGGAIDGTGAFLCTYVANGFDPATPPPAGTTLHVPGDFASIQDAVDAAQEGDTIVVGPGHWNETVALNALDNVTLRGNGHATIDPGHGSAFTAHDCVGLRLSGFKLRAQDDSPLFLDNPSRTIVEDCDVKSLTLTPIDCKDVSGLVLRNCVVEADQTAAIVVDGFCALVDDCTVIGGAGIEMSGPRMVVENCHLQGCQPASIKFLSLQSGQTSVDLARDNSVADATYAFHVDEDTDLIALLDNHVTRGKSGILVNQDATHAIVTGNRMKKPASDGIISDGPHALLDDNRVTSPVENGIRCGSATNNALWSRNRVMKSKDVAFSVGNAAPTLVANRSKKTVGTAIELDPPGTNLVTGNSFH